MITPEDALDVTDAVGRLVTDVPLEVVCVIPQVVQSWCDPVLVGIGEPGAVSARPREVLRAVLTSGGCAFVLAHTHLSVDGPSPQDLAVTRRLVAAAAVVGVPMLAHLVIGPQHVWDCTSGRRWSHVQRMARSVSALATPAVTGVPASADSS